MRQKQSLQGGFQALLIDLDHCPRHIEQLPQTLDHFTRVIACYGDTEPRVPLSLVTLLAAAIQQGKLEIIGMKKSGHNATDFGLAFWAGRLMAEMPPDTTFAILSQDGDLDHVVHLLESAQRRVVRIGETLGSQMIMPQEESPAAAEPAALGIDEATVTLYATLHLKPGRSRPAKKATLANSIQSFLRNHKKTDSVASVLQGLQDRGLVSFDVHGRVSYPTLPAVQDSTPVVEAVVEEVVPPPLSRPLFNEDVVPF